MFFSDHVPEEVLDSTEEHSGQQQMYSSGIQTNGYAETSLVEVNADVIRLRQSNARLSDGQTPVICNGLTKHKTQPNICCEKRCESKSCPEKGTVVSGASREEYVEMHLNSKCDKVSTHLGVAPAKAPADHDSRLADGEQMDVDGAAERNDKMDPDQDKGNRPYICHTCNVSYGHPQILTIHLQSASHHARASVESVQPSGTEAQPQLGFAQVSEVDADEDAVQTNEVDKGDRDNSGTGLNNDETRSLPVDSSETKVDEATFLAVKRTIDGRHGVAKQDEKAIENEQHSHKSELGISEHPAPRARHASNVRRYSPTARETRLIKDQLLESYGLEFAMHHCESRRKKRKTVAENPTNNASEQTATNNLAWEALRADDYVCPLCQKCFSGLWIFKLHVEETHHKYVPREVLEVHMEDLSKEIRRRHKTNSHTAQEAEPQPNVTTQSSRSESQVSSEHSSSTFSGPRADDNAKISAKPEENCASSASQLPVSDIQTVLTLIQAAHIRYQMQQLNPLLASQMAALGSPLSAFGLSDTSAQSHQLLSLIAAQQLLNPSVLWTAQAQALAQQQQQAQTPPSASGKPTDCKRPADSSVGGGREEKRARTRIDEYQLMMLRAHFDVERTPSHEVVKELGKQCGLAPKVVKHWFRNTLFKECQRDKDSPYNFNVPPGTSLELTQQGRPNLSVVHSDELSRSSPTIDIGGDSVGQGSKSERDEKRKTTQLMPPQTTKSEDAVAVDLSSRTPCLAHDATLTSDCSHSSSLLRSSSSPPPAHNGNRQTQREADEHVVAWSRLGCAGNQGVR